MRLIQSFQIQFTICSNKTL